MTNQDYEMYASKIMPMSLSEGTKDILKSMMQDANLPMKLQQELLKAAYNGRSLPWIPKQSQKAEMKEVNNAVKIQMSSLKPGLRTKNTIELSGAYKREQFRPSPSRSRSSKEKERLQNLMAFGNEHEPSVKNLNKCISDKPIHSSVGNKFEEILIEIEERKEFLEDMIQLGMGKKYASQIEFEISQRISELEQLDKERSKKALSRLDEN